MDELDRLYRRLVQNVRAAFPELLTRPFEVSHIYQQLIPYRHNRRELSLETNEDYELALTQLLSGARGLLMGDDEMQRALREELELPNPDLSAYRAYATSMVSLSPEALRALEAQPALQPTPALAAQAPHGRSAADQAVLAARTTEQVNTRRVPERGAPASGLPSVAAPPLGARARGPGAPANPPVVSESGRAVSSTCRFCAGQLPEGKDVVFCPHCGHDLTVKHCPACNSELEIGWRYCITCGRESDSARS
jgi:hypothetical protein